MTAATDTAAPARSRTKTRYNRAMDEPTFTALSAWLTQAGLTGMPESDIVTGSVRALRCGRPAARPRPGLYRHAASGPRRPAVPLGPWARRSRHAGIWPHQPRRARRGRRGSERRRNRRALAAQSVLPHAAKRRLGFAPAPQCRVSRRVLVPAGLARRGDDRLCRHHHPLCRRRHHRRDGCRIFVMGDEGARRFY